MNEELDIERLLDAERVELCRGRVRQEGHVRLVDGGKTADGGTIEGEARLGSVFSKLGGRNGEVILGAGDVSETHVDETYVLVLDKFHDVLDGLECHGFDTPCE